MSNLVGNILYVGFEQSFFRKNISSGVLLKGRKPREKFDPKGSVEDNHVFNPNRMRTFNILALLGALTPFHSFISFSFQAFEFRFNINSLKMSLNSQ